MKIHIARLSLTPVLCMCLLASGFTLQGYAQGASAQATTAESQDAAAILRSYPKSRALDQVISALNGKLLPANSNWILYGNYFKDGEARYSPRFAVDDTGHTTTATSVFDWAEMGIADTVLTGTQLAALQLSLKALPPSAHPASLADVLVLSFRSDETWSSRVYDRTKLPEPVKTILALTKIVEGTGVPVELPRQTAHEPGVEARFEIAPLYQKVFELVQRYYPNAAVTTEGDTIHFEYNTQSFMIHRPNMVGEWQAARAETGPKRGGILGDITLLPGRYNGQAMVPQSWDIHYFTEYLMAPDSKTMDAHLSALIKYPKNVPDGFLKELTELLNNFDKYVTPRTTH